ncbi:MAG TPA: AlpA family phage regulatory protein [Bacteroidetes bacterium]|nr:AlpA family phage regulatory protein [Bacteroidota bacterium]
MNNQSKETNKLKKELQSFQPNKLIRIKGVSGLTNLSKSYIYQLCKEDLFPQSVQLVAGGTSVAWVESEVLDWIESRIQARDEENANV